MRLVFLITLVWISHACFSTKDTNLSANKLYAQYNFCGNPGVNIIEGYDSINTIKQLLSKIRNFPVVIHLWATWCEPCIAEFRYNSSIYSFLSTNKVEIIYVSFDKKNADSTWRRVLQDKRIIGYHVRATPALQDEITTLIWGAKGGYDIPHSFLFDRFGTIVNRNLPSFEKQDSLFSLIKSELRLSEAIAH